MDGTARCGAPLLGGAPPLGAAPLALAARRRARCLRDRRATAAGHRVQGQVAKRRPPRLPQAGRDPDRGAPPRRLGRPRHRPEPDDPDRGLPPRSPRPRPPPLSPPGPPAPDPPLAPPPPAGPHTRKTEMRTGWARGASAALSG